MHGDNSVMFFVRRALESELNVVLYTGQINQLNPQQKGGSLTGSSVNVREY